MPEIKTGDALLNYESQLISVIRILGEAFQTCNNVQQRLESGMYQGRAMEDMRQYFQMLSVHISQLMVLYQKGAQYVMNTYQTAYENDEQLQQWILDNFGTEGESGNAVGK